MEDNYIPFGREWQEDLMKLKKADMVALYREEVMNDQHNALQRLMIDITEWSDSAFGEGQRNPAILHHLAKEVKECIEAVEKFQKVSVKSTSYNESESLCQAAFEEYADCFMLLLDSAYHFGLDANAILHFTRQKLEINKLRRWGKPDENGVVEHIKEG